ncbi:Rbr2 [Desulforapulum autotrophicum HRM2]|uniref:Rbr2 n=2 Tax=Desulforapulum autotrophicum TaxID=2296 RepID=C0QER8_DESAH|nr:Rbr2 [Desulforapulum autotrophicum HRM2]
MLTMFSISEIIALAVEIEKNAEETYRRAMDQSRNPEVKALLLWMANEEKDHATWFNTLKDEIDKHQDLPSDKTMEMDGDFIGDLMEKQSFFLGDTDLTIIKDKNKLNEIFIEFENDTILFYEMIKTFITHAPTIKHLEKIIEEENTHIKQLDKISHLD